MKKITYDSQVDAAYVYLVQIHPGGVEKTVQATSDVLLDFNKYGQLIGIEVLNASKTLPEELLKKAE